MDACSPELTQNGRRPFALPAGEQRSFLEDGDQVILRGHCERPGFVSIGLGECSGTITHFFFFFFFFFFKKNGERIRMTNILSG